MGSHEFLLSIVITLNIFQIASASVATSDFFPYELHEGVERFYFSDDSTHSVRLTSPFRLLNHSHWDAFISSNGMVTFERAYAESSPRCTVPGNTAKVMPYWSDCTPGGGATITYIQSRNSNLLLKAKKEIDYAYPSLNDLTLNWIFAITWMNVPGHNLDSSLRNTFQATLVTDSTGENSFVLFYYNRIDWAHSSKTPSVGFDAGDSTTEIYTVPDSCSSAIKDIVHKSNVGQPGKWVFKVDSQIISGRTCISKVKSSAVTFSPNVIPVMGNVPLKIESLCLEHNVSISCEFRDPSKTHPIQTKGIIFSNGINVVCPVPFLYSLGKMRVDLIVSSPSNVLSLYEGHIFVTSELNSGSQPRISLNERMKETRWLTVDWNPDSVTLEEYKNLDQKGNDTCHSKHGLDLIEITLIEYDGNEWRDVGPITKPVVNNGIFVIPLEKTNLLEMVGRRKNILIRTLAIRGQYKLSNGAEIATLLPSDILNGMETLQNAQDMGIDKMKRVCTSWYNHEPAPPHDTLPCPILSEQARMDWRFILDKKASATAEKLNVSQVYVQRVPSSSGGGSQCSYDLEGRLIINGLNAYGGVHRSSPMNWKNYWSYYWNDILPYVYCCTNEEQDNSGRAYYEEKRPMDNSLAYKFPQVAKVVGQGHITTFDGLQYRFMSVGEYIMIKHSSDELIHSYQHDFEMHVGFGLETIMYHTIQTAVFLQNIQGRKVKVQVYSKFTESKLIVLVDDSPIDVDSDLNLYFSGLIITVRSKNDIILAFASGFSFNILSGGSGTILQSFNVIGMAAPRHNGTTMGLWGDADSVRENDLRYPNGTLVPKENVSGTNYDNYARGWKVAANDTLISDTADFIFYAPRRLPPQEISFGYDHTGTVLLYHNQTEQEFCGGDTDCDFDYQRVHDIPYAEATKAANSVFEDLVEVSSLKIKLCPDLRASVRKWGNLRLRLDNYLVGSKLQVYCTDDGDDTAKGQNYINYTCLDKDDKVAWVNPIHGEVNIPLILTMCKPGQPRKFIQSDDQSEVPSNVEPIKASLSGNVSHSNSSEVTPVILIIGILIACIAAVVVIMKYPPCASVKQRIVNVYNRLH